MKKHKSYRKKNDGMTAGYSVNDAEFEKYPPYMCCDGHPPIGYWIEEGDDERCPVCMLNDALDAAIERGSD